MSRRRGAAVGVLALCLIFPGCAVKRIENGVYHSSKGYQVAIPSSEWLPVDGSPADLELRHRGLAAAIAVNAVCDGSTPRRPPAALARQLRVGLRDRVVIERGTVQVAGRTAARLVMDTRLEEAETRVRVASLALTGGPCLYDFLHVAPPDRFEASRADFDRFVDSFRAE